jgi:hypothetical protein
MKKQYKGYIRNLSDGTVEVVAEVFDDDFDTFMKILKEGSLLSRVVHGERTRGREIVVKQYDFPARIQWTEVDMLFITGGAGIKFDKFTGPAAENNVLTVGEETGFCSRGGMINLVTRGRRILIEVNIGQIRKGGFRVSAQVLKLARIVKSVSGEDQ